MEKKETAQYKLGLALGGGGAKGFAHLGVFQALEERELKPDIISGTSAGCFAGVLYADGNSPKDIVKMFQHKAFSEFAQLTLPNAGLFKSDKFLIFLEKNVKARKYEDLKIPLVAVATDIEEGKSVLFSKGDLLPTIVASCSYPIVFQPKNIDGKYYVDGGVFKNFPVSVIRKKCDFMLGVNVSPLTGQKFKNSMLYVAERSFHYMSSSNSLADKKMCDLLIEPADVIKYTTFDLDHIDEIFKLGYDAANKLFDANEEKMKQLYLLKEEGTHINNTAI